MTVEQTLDWLRGIYVASLYMEPTVADLRTWLLCAITLSEQLQTELNTYKVATQNWHEEAHDD